MSDETDPDLKRLFAVTAEHPVDEAFVAGVNERVVRERRLAWASRVALAAVGLVVVIALSAPSAHGLSAVGLASGSITALVAGLTDTVSGRIALVAVSVSLWFVFNLTRRTA